MYLERRDLLVRAPQALTAILIVLANSKTSLILSTKNEFANTINLDSKTDDTSLFCVIYSEHWEDDLSATRTPEDTCEQVD